MGWFRVGSERYARESRTFGITTLTKRHVTVRGSRIAFSFRGSTGCSSARGRRRRARRAIRELLAAPGRPASSGTSRRTRLQPHRRRLNDYVGEHLGEEFSAKDFRTWGGTLLAAVELAERGRRRSETETEEGDRRGDAARSAESSETHRPSRAASYCQPGGDRAVSRRENDRRFPAARICASSGHATRILRRGTAMLSLLRSWRIRRARRGGLSARRLSARI